MEGGKELDFWVFVIDGFAWSKKVFSILPMEPTFMQDRYIFVYSFNMFFTNVSVYVVVVDDSINLRVTP